MQHDRLIELASQFKAAGVDAAELRRMQTELDMLESPPGLFSRLTRSARAAAGRQWANIVGELKESGELMGILRRRIAEGERLSEAEADKVRAQVLDMMRMVPAGVIAVANSALPVPGTGLLTPWILARLGLMPSRWREAHLLDQLRKASEHLREQGLHEQAARIDALGRELEDEADARDRAAHDAALLTHWDANDNGQWDTEERATYATALEAMMREARARAAQKRWFLSIDHQVFGPVRLSEISAATSHDGLLVCFDGKSGWFALDHLLGGDPSSS